MLKRQTAVVYLDANKILFYIKENKNSLQLDLPAEVVSDLEVVNRQKFDELIDSFFQKESFKGMEFDGVLVFSQNTTFEKDFIQDTVKAQYEDIQKFLDLVPFEDVLSNAYKLDKKTKVVAVNKGLYEAVIEAFQRNKVFISLALPITVLVETNEEFAKNLDLGIIATKPDSLQQYSLIDFSQSIEGNRKNSIGIKKKDVRLYLLLGVFAFLLLILFILIYTTFFSSKQKPVPALPVKNYVSPSPKVENNTVAPSVRVSTPSSSLVSTPEAKTQ